ncbi:hypothetical protein Pelo_19199 [Pelomyxa schiedti]|nr:hypothetical protein Pelo_19199 [Pelomyxa schiedti]
MQGGRATIQRLIDAREQIFVVCLAVHNPTSACACLTNDVVRLIGERWVLTPVRRFIVVVPSTGSSGAGLLPPTSFVVSIGPTAGVVRVHETDGGEGPFHYLSVMCWLGCGKLMFLNLRDLQLQVADVTQGWLTRVLEPPGGELSLEAWGNHKWAVARCSRGLYLHLHNKEEEAPELRGSGSAAWVLIDAFKNVRQADVVFSHTVPRDVIGDALDCGPSKELLKGILGHRDGGFALWILASLPVHG